MALRIKRRIKVRIAKHRPFTEVVESRARPWRWPRRYDLVPRRELVAVHSAYRFAMLADIRGVHIHLRGQIGHTGFQNLGLDLNRLTRMV